MSKSSGRGIAYLTMLTMLALSIAGNVAHTYHLDSTPSFRSVVYAVMWPVMVWLGVEMFVRVQWPNGLAPWLVRWVGITLVAFIAGLVSYRHLRGLLIADGEDAIVYNVGPLAIDGLMLMATLALLLTRKAVTNVPAEHSNVDAEIERLTALHEEQEQTQEIEPVSPAVPTFMPMPSGATQRLSGELTEHATKRSVIPDVITMQALTRTDAVIVDQDEQPKARASRTGSADREAKVRAMLEDPELKPADSTMRRYAKVAREMRANPTMDVDYKGVQREVVETIIRPWANLERVR